MLCAMNVTRRCLYRSGNVPEYNRSLWWQSWKAGVSRQSIDLVTIRHLHLVPRDSRTIGGQRQDYTTITTGLIAMSTFKRQLKTHLFQSAFAA